MKIKSKPEDFIVEELAEHEFLKTGDYKVYLLEKTGWETLALLGMLSNKFNIPRDKIGIAGIKDTRAKTTQYVSIPSNCELKDCPNVTVKFVGFLDFPISLGDLVENKFTIIVRDIEKSEIPKIIVNSKFIKHGIPNYFDSQRFGSVVEDNFIAKDLIRKDYESAVKKYLTIISPGDSDTRKTDKKNILNSWPRFDLEVKSFDLKHLINKYKERQNWSIVYKNISAPLRQLFISAYQSYIWNECVKLLLESRLEESKVMLTNYAVGDLVFNKTKLNNLPDYFPTISHKMEGSEEEFDVINRVLKKEGFTLDQFNIRQSGNFFKSRRRQVMMFPSNLELSEPIQEGSKYSVKVNFSLPKGSYATVVLKRIFGE